MDKTGGKEPPEKAQEAEAGSTVNLAPWTGLMRKGGWTRLEAQIVIPPKFESKRKL